MGRKPNVEMPFVFDRHDHGGLWLTDVSPFIEELVIELTRTKERLKAQPAARENA